MMEGARPHDVLVVGAGPVGLALLLALRRAGLDAVAVDRGTGPTSYPKSRVVSARSMELLRRWGVADAVSAAALPGDWTERIVVGHSLAGPELLRVESAGYSGTASPERRVLCTQDRLERILAGEVAGAVCWQSEAVAVEDQGEHVEVTVRGAGGRVERHRGRYAVLADGCRGLGAGPAVPGAGVRRRLLSQVSFRFQTDLRPLVAHRPAFVSYLVGSRHPAALLVVDGARDWVVMTVAGRGETPADFPAKRLREMLAGILGRPADHPTVATAAIEPPRLWDIGYRVADRFVHGRVIRAGDAAHELPPTGATGLNLGLSDVDALAWRLVAMLDGWADPALLDGYDRERRPIADRTARWTRECLNAAPALAAAATRDDATALAKAARQLAVYIDHPGLDLGPLLPPHAQDPTLLVDDGRPGSRAPHIPLGATGTSTIDCYTAVPVLLAGAGTARAAERWAERMSVRHAIPLRVLSMTGPRRVAGWDRRHGVDADGAVLVRPDGYVWWRGRWPDKDLSGLETELLALAGRNPAG